MSELRITPVQVPVSQAKGVDPAFLAAAQQGSVQRGLPSPLRYIQLPQPVALWLRPTSLTLHALSQSPRFHGGSIPRSPLQ